MASENHQPAEILSGYQFVELDQLPLWCERIELNAAQSGLKGTVLLAAEGINFSLSGPARALDDWLAWIGRRLGCDAPVVNRQRVDAPPFLRLKVRIRDEIVTFDPRVKPTPENAGRALSPLEWNALLEREGLQLVDARNDYEYGIGSFEGAVNPHTSSFTEFKEYCRRHLNPEKPVAMFCTGGVRCEKASAWLKARGFSEVFQLHGGILGYIAATPPEASRWHGECFVFDDRVSVDDSLRPTGRVVCRGCRKPAEGLDPAGVPPISADGECRLCGQVFDDARLGSLRERSRQVELARERGYSHLGPDAQS
ncbi:MAG: rhodanese-like domain-containing protein [Wenzhouxiangellaceae bacterium]